MTFGEFKQYCEEVSYETADADWNQRETLRGISAALSNVVIDFSYDADQVIADGNVCEIC